MKTVFLIIIGLILVCIISYNIYVSYQLIQSPIYGIFRKIIFIFLIWLIPYLGGYLILFLIHPLDKTPSESDRYIGQSIDESKHHLGGRG